MEEAWGAEARYHAQSLRDAGFTAQDAEVRLRGGGGRD